MQSLSQESDTITDKKNIIPSQGDDKRLFAL